MYFLVSAIIFLIDQMSKGYVVHTIKPFQIIYILPFLNIIEAENRGIAWGLFRDLPLSNSVFSILGTIVLILSIVFLNTSMKKTSLQRSGVWLIATGGLSNICDRLFRGYVVDYIDFHIGPWHFPTFNIADAVVTLGMIIIVLSAYLDRD